jgi:hypothetical protein
MAANVKGLEEALASGHKSHLTTDRLGLHEYGDPIKFSCYQDPNGMLWRAIDKDGNEPIGVFTHRDTTSNSLHAGIDAYNREQARMIITQMRRTEYEEYEKQRQA